MGVRYIILTLCVGAALAQTNITRADVLKALPANLQGTLSETQIEDMGNKTTVLLKQKCENNGGPGVYDNLVEAAKNFSKCIKDLVDYQTLSAEIEKAKPDGKVDEVFKKHCDKKPVFLNCFDNLTNVVKKCLTSEEQEHIKPLRNATEQLAEFICYKDGDRIALFIAENGPECLSNKSSMINDCVSSAYNTSDFAFNNLSQLEVPVIAFGDKECNQLTHMQSCVVSSLETCSTPTAANIIEALFKFARKSLPCKEIPDDEAVDLTYQKAEPTKPSSGSRVAVATFTITAAMITRMFI